MKNRMILMTFAVCMLLLIGGEAQANILNLGSTYSYIDSFVNGSEQTVGGGSVEPSSLNGHPLEYVYCVDLFDVIYVPNSYENTTVTTTGYVNGSLVNSAGEVAWLLSTYGAPGQGNDAQALQAAIWTEIYGHSLYHLAAISPAYSLYTMMLANVAVTNIDSDNKLISDFFWLSPGHNDSNVVYQGLETSPSLQSHTFSLRGL